MIKFSRLTILEDDAVRKLVMIKVHVLQVRLSKSLLGVFAFHVAKSLTGRNMQHPTILGVVGQQCCIGLHVAKSIFLKIAFSRSK